MITIELEGKEYKMPESWDEVNVGLFEEITKMATLLPEYKSEVQYTIDMFSVLTGAPIDSLSRMTRKGFEDLAKATEWVNEEVKSSEKEIWEFDGVEYMPVKNLDSLTMGDSVSLELMIKESNEATILANILPILVRRVKKLKGDGDDIKKIPGDFDADSYNEVKELFKRKMMVTDVIKLKSFF